MRTRYARQIRRGLQEARRVASTGASTLYWEESLPPLTRRAYYWAIERYFPGRSTERKLLLIPKPAKATYGGKND